MNFFYPNYLWYILLIIPYTAILPFYYRKQLEVLHLLCRHNLNDEMLQAYRHYFNLLAFFAGLFVLSIILALAQPAWGYNNRVEPQVKNLQIVFALDISRSMLARDVTPNRLQRAIELLGELHEIFQNDELGLVVFKGRAQTLIPLSRDRLVFPSVFPQLNTDILQSPGSNLAAAVRESIKLFDHKSNSSQVIILLSDGESISGDLNYAQQRLDDWDGTLISIGVGTREGSEIFDQQDKLVTDYHGLPVHSRLCDDVLKDLSHHTFGKYYHIQELNLTQDLQNQLAPLTRGNHILQYSLLGRYQLCICLSLLSFLAIAILKRFGFTGFYHFLKTQRLLLRQQNHQSTMVTDRDVSLHKIGLDNQSWRSL